ADGWSTLRVGGIVSPVATGPQPSAASAALPIPNHLRVDPVIGSGGTSIINCLIGVCLGATVRAQGSPLRWLNSAESGCSRDGAETISVVDQPAGPPGANVNAALAGEFDIWCSTLSSASIAHALSSQTVSWRTVS